MFLSIWRVCKLTHTKTYEISIKVMIFIPFHCITLNGSLWMNWMHDLPSKISTLCVFAFRFMPRWLFKSILYVRQWNALRWPLIHCPASWLCSLILFFTLINVTSCALEKEWEDFDDKFLAICIVIVLHALLSVISFYLMMMWVQSKSA
jgi:hypothetical protein